MTPIFVLASAAFFIFKMMRADTHTVAVIATTVIAIAAAYPFIAPKLNEPHSSSLMDREHKEAHPEIASPLFPVSRVPKKGFIYLAENPPLVELFRKLRVVRMFDRPRFQELAVTLDKLQKTYMYLLGRRLTPRDGIPLFFDLKDRALELLYSFYFVTPMKLKHVYGLKPHARIQESIRTFAALSTKMNNVLRDFVRVELGEPWTYSDIVIPANQRPEASVLP